MNVNPLMLAEFQEEVLALFIPIIAIVMGVILGMLGMFFRYRRRREMFALYHQERMAALDKGIELPPLPEGFFSERSARGQSPHRSLRMGLIWSAVGITLGIALYFNRKPSAALFALIPMGVGIAQLVYYALVGKRQALELERREREEHEAKRKAVGGG